MTFVVLSAACANAQTLSKAAPARSAVFPLDLFWTHAADAPFAAAPAVDGRRIFVALQTGRLMALEPGAKEAVWSVELAADGAPVAGGGRVFVPAAGAIQALDASNGQLAWRLPAGVLAAPLLYRAGWLIVAGADGALQAVRASDGVVVWAKALGAPLAVPASIDGNVMSVALADARLLVMDLPTGTVRWTRSVRARPNALTLSGDRIFVGTDDGTFWSIETRDGDADWPWRLGAKLIGAPAADAERVYLIANDNVVRGLRRRSGNERWRLALPTRALDGPAVIDDLLVVTTAAVGSPGLTYINAATGAAAGTTPAIPKSDDTVRVQYPVVFSSGDTPFAVLVTATVAGDWQLHAFRQTFLTAISAPITWGKSYEIRRRLEFRVGVVVFGEPVPLVPLVPRVP